MSKNWLALDQQHRREAQEIQLTVPRFTPSSKTGFFTSIFRKLRKIFTGRDFSAEKSAIIRQQKEEIKDYAMREYKTNWEQEYRRLCGIADARLAEKVIEQRGGALSETHQKVLQAWQKNWFEKDGFEGGYDDSKLNSTYRYAIHETFAWLEQRFGAIKFANEKNRKKGKPPAKFSSFI